VSARPEEPQSRSPSHVPPSASLEVLRLRAELLDRTRSFFSERGVLEVETPLIATALVVDAHIDPVECRLDAAAEPRYLLPSPEAPMKRLLAAGSGPIFQIAKAFRRGERGRLHQPEFTMLEWYRPGLGHHELMDEVGELMRDLLGVGAWVKRTHREVFQEVLGVDPHAATAEELAAVAKARGVAFRGESTPGEPTAWLDLLFAACVEPALDPETATFVHDFPASQTALATLTDTDPPVAQRFELLYGGMELCNGYQELLDPEAHHERFEAANAERERMGKDRLPPDEHLIAAVERGLPACSGVAVGFDRVVMLACGAGSIDDVLAFPS
jgi:lysyl-tRNA synthetase class 2